MQTDKPILDCRTEDGGRTLVAEGVEGKCAVGCGPCPVAITSPGVLAVVLLIVALVAAVLGYYAGANRTADRQT